jgi:hypothetical protein
MDRRTKGIVEVLRGDAAAVRLLPADSQSCCSLQYCSVFFVLSNLLPHRCGFEPFLINPIRLKFNADFDRR